MRNRNLLVLGGALVALAMAAPAGAGALYRYTAADGSVAFTDDPKRIPEGLREGATRVATRGLGSYERYTPTSAPEAADYAVRLEARLERLRALNRTEPDARSAAHGEPRPSTILRLDEHTSIAIPDRRDGGAGDAPVVVEEMRVRAPDAVTTQHVTVVRQGDEVLSIVKPRASSTNPHPPSLDEFLD